MQRLLTLEHLSAVADSFRLASVDALYAIGEGNIGAPGVVQRLIGTEGGLDGAADEGPRGDHGAAQAGRRAPHQAGAIPASSWRATPTCGSSSRSAAPVPRRRDPRLRHAGERDLRAPTRLHECTDLLTHPERIVEVSWAPNSSSSYLLSIQVETYEDVRGCSPTSRTLADEQVNISSATVAVSKNQLAKLKMTFESTDHPSAT